MAKTSGALTMLRLLQRAGITPEQVDFVLDCTETAIGDRYNRGGGSMSKAVAEMADASTPPVTMSAPFAVRPPTQSLKPADW